MADTGAVRELFAVFGFKFQDEELKKAETALGKLTKSVTLLGKTITAGLLIKGSYALAESIAAVGDRLDAQSRRLGLNTDSLQEFEFAAEQAGASAESFAASLLQLQDRQGDALKNSGGENAKNFKRLGVAFKQANGEAVDSETLFVNVAKAIAKLPSDAAKANAAIDIFGRQGKELLPLLKEGAAGLDAYRKRFRELGGGYDKEAIAASDDFGDSQKELATAVKSVGGEVAKRLLPWLTKLHKAGALVVGAFASFAKQSKVIEVLLGSLATLSGGLAAKLISSVVPALWAMAAPFLLAAAKATALYLVLEDIYYFLTGGESVLGDIIDGIFGKGASLETVETLKVIWRSIADAIKEAYQWVTSITRGIDEALAASARAGERFFGTAKPAIAGGNRRFQGFGKPLLPPQSTDPFASVPKSIAAPFSAPLTQSGLAAVTNQNSFTINNNGDPAAVERAVHKGIANANRDAAHAVVRKGRR